MPLTRGDKIIIGSAVALAAAVVLGLAALKKPFLFSHETAPQPVAIEPAPAAMQPGPPPSAKPVTSPVETPATAAPTAAPASAPATPPAPAGPTTTPMAGPPPAPAPGPAAAKPAGDETLDKMFAEITKSDAGPGKAAEPKPAGPEQDTVATSPGSVPVVVAKDVEPAPAEATAEKAAPAAASAKAKKAAKAEKATKPTKGAKAGKGKAATPAPAPKAAKAEKPAKPAPADAAVAGHVIRLVAEQKSGEYVLTVQTSQPPAHFQKMFIADPPRMVLDLSGNWTYSGPLSQATGERFVRQIRVGKHKEMFRVVLDLGPDALSQLRGTPTAERVPGGVVLKIPK